MAKAVIIYGSTTGNTELMAGHVAIGMKEAGVDVSVLNVTDADSQVLKDYDIVVLGSSTWNEGLQEDFEPFYMEMEDISLNGKPAAAFGPGDSSFGDTFCEAVTMLEDRLRECGARIVTSSLRVDGDVEAAEGETREWGKQVASAAVRAGTL